MDKKKKLCKSQKKFGRKNKQFFLENESQTEKLMSTKQWIHCDFSRPSRINESELIIKRLLLKS